MTTTTHAPIPPRTPFERVLRWLRTLFGLKRADQPVLAQSAPLFAVVTAASVVIATFTRAVFLTDHETKMLPWMFLGSSVFTAVVSIAYVAIMERTSLTRRFVGLLLVAQISFAGLHLAYPLHPKGIALVQLVWCTGIANLILLQAWNMMSALVPSRQGKRLFPVLAAISTLGAAAGGGMVSLFLSRGMEARHLLWLVLALLAWPLWRVPKIVRAVTGLTADASEEAPSALRATRVDVPKERGSDILRGFRNIRDTPLLLRLALLVFLLQVASLILDYQFSTELKARYVHNKESIAGFLGTYYAISNSVAFFVALMATGRIVRLVGIGVAISASAIIIGIGSISYLVCRSHDLPYAFWAIVATSFMERIGQFALTRNAMQMLVMPLDAKKGERAKTLIDGVVYRVGTASVSIGLLLMAPTAAQLGMLSWGTALACVGVVILGLAMAPHYRRALFEGLRARRVDSDADPQTAELLQQNALREAQQRLRAERPLEIVQALDMVREMRLPVGVADVMPAARSSDPEVARRALEVMSELGMKPERAMLLGLLTKDKSPPVLRECLRLLMHFPDKGLIPLVSPFVHHDDLAVARLAVMWMRLAGGEAVTSRIHRELIDDLRSQAAGRRARAAFISGSYDNDPAFDLASMIEDPSMEVRLNAVQSMGQIGSAEFIDPLIKALSQADLVPAASQALLRFGPPLVGALAEIIAERPPHPAIQLRLFRVVERFGTNEARDFLMEQLGPSHASVVRDGAVQSLWRMAREPERPRPPRPWLAMQLLEEIERLQRFQIIEMITAGQTQRHKFFHAELGALRIQAESRGFRLLGLLHSRAAMHRAFMYYRSTQQRVRSNAIELLDQHLTEPELKPFVALVEQRADAALSGPADGATMMQMVGFTLDLDTLLKDEPWLARVWQWVELPRVVNKLAGGDKMARDPMDMVFLLKAVPLFSDLSGEQLLPLTDIVQQVHVEQGDLVFAEGEPGDSLYVIVEGEVDVLNAGERRASLRVKECFGEMALLDASPRSASCRARTNLELLSIARDDFQDLLDLHPALARGVIRVLTQRLRAANEHAAEAKPVLQGKTAS